MCLIKGSVRIVKNRFLERSFIEKLGVNGLNAPVELLHGMMIQINLTSRGFSRKSALIVLRCFNNTSYIDAEIHIWLPDL